MQMKSQSYFFVFIVLLFSSEFVIAQQQSIIECEKAATAQKRGQQEEALVRLKSCLAENPDYAPALALRAKIFTERKQYSAALQIHNTLISKNVDYSLFADSWGQALLETGQNQTIVDFQEYAQLPTSVRDNWLIKRAAACMALKDYSCSESSFLSLTSSKQNTASKLIGLAQIELIKGDFERARLFLEEASSVTPGSATIDYFYGQLAYRQKQPSQAIKLFKLAYEKDPTNTLVLRGLADALLMNEQQLQASQVLTEILALEPGDPMALVTQEILNAKIKQQSSPSSEFLDMTNRVRSLTDEQVDADLQLLYLRGMISFLERNYESALRDFFLLYKKDKSDTQVIIMLAKTQFALQKNRDATRILENNIKALETSPEILIQLADQYIKQNQTFKVVNLLSKLKEDYPDNRRIKLLNVRYLIARGKRNEAEALLDALVKSEKNNLEVQQAAALYYIQRKNIELARRSIEHIQTIDNSFESRQMIASFELMTGDIATAKRSLDKLSLEQPSNIAVMFNLAVIDIESGNMQQGVERLKEVLKLSPDHSNSLYMLGVSALREGRIAEAKGFLQQARLTAEDPSLSLNALIALEENQRNYDAAIDYANQLVEHSYGNVLNLMKRVKLFLKAERYSMAKAELLRIEDFTELAYSDYLGISGLYLQANAPKEAIAVLEKGYKKTKDTTLLINAIEFSLNSNDTQNALTLFKALPNDFYRQTNVKFLSARLAEQLNKVEEAKAQYIDIAKQDPMSNLVMAKLYNFSSDARVKSQLLETLQARIESNDNDFFAHNLLGQIYFYDQLWQQAKKQYTRVLAFESIPNRASTLNRLSVISDQLGDLSDLVYFAQKAYELDDANPLIMSQLGWGLARTGQGPQGLKYLRQALSLNSSNQTIRYYVAKTLVQLELYEEALVEIETIKSSETEPYIIESAQKLHDEVAKFYP